MMQICYDSKTGVILYTVDGGDTAPVTDDGAWISLVAPPNSSFDPAAWRVQDGTLLPAAPDLAARRATMVCSPLQGRLVLGPEICAALDAMVADPATPWAVRETISKASEWHRTSQTIDTLGWAMGFSPEQMDALFEAAVQVRV